MSFEPAAPFRTVGVRRRRRGNVSTWAIRVAAALVLFALGVAFGQALEESPSPGRTSTSFRTLAPLQLTPETVTVTVTAP